MMADIDVRVAIRSKVERMSALLSARDGSIVDEIWTPGFRLVGSEHGEVATDRARLERLFAMLFARPARYAFDFPSFAVEERADVAWLFAEGDLIATGPDGVTRHPYRLTAVFLLGKDGWRWRLFSGSEPAGAPD